MRRHHPRPGGRAPFHPVVLNLDSPHVSRIVVRYHARRHHSADPRRCRLYVRGVILPRSDCEFITVAVSQVVLMQDLDQSVIALRFEAETGQMDLVSGLESMVPAPPVTENLRADRAGA